LAALRHFEQALEQVERTDICQQESLAIAQDLPDEQEKAFVLLLNGMGSSILTHRQSVDLCQQCISIFQCLGDTWGTALAQLVLGDEACFGGIVDAELAQRSYKSALEGFGHLGNEWGQALCKTGLARVERQAGHLEEAYRIARQGLDTYCRMGDMWRAVFARRALAEIAEELGRFDKARHHLEANLAHFSQMGDERGREEYHERLEHLDDRIRSTGPETRTEETSAPVAPPAQPSRPSAGDLVEPLSAREIEILHLLAEGLTNREIAQQIYLYPNTVRVHTSHIYGKLGVNNRTQAVARARATGLLTSS
jgi:ATP/maltotriose-dependent transcriptional regulator MalT